MKINKEKLQWLVEYTKERSSVYYKKEILKQPAPWTGFPELTYFKFTNVKRFLDRETKWSIKNILDNNELTPEDKALNTTLFIGINSGKSMEFFLNGPVKYHKIYDTGEKPFFDDLVKFEDNARIKNNENYTSGKEWVKQQSNAYFLSAVGAQTNRTCPDEYKRHLTGRAYFMWKYKTDIFNAWNANSFEEAEKYMQNVPAYRQFLGYQALTTMSYSNETKFTDDEYILCGPGTRGGLSYLFEDYNECTETAEDMIEYLRYHIEDICKENGLSWDIEKWLHFLPESQRVFTRQDWTNAMCELNKLCKLRSGVGMRKRYYNFNSH